MLVSLYKKNLVKINHSALELVCAKSLLKDGYSVKVEQRLDSVLVCDLLGTARGRQVVVEIETGFIPPESALEPSAYAQSRIASKIARYGRFGGKFALGTTPSYVLNLPAFFIGPRRGRTASGAAEIKALTDVHYHNPPVSMEELMQARLDSIFIIDVDSASTHEVDPRKYSESAAAFVGSNGFSQGLYPVKGSREGGFNFGQDTV